MKTKTIIAGPCSAESKQQVLTTARQLKDQNINYFRAGLWKPRTRPGAFEGVGSKGLEWMREAKHRYGLPICTEVANVRHVYESLKAGMDMVWIGARTTTNPFAVQEIAEALSGINIPVMVKNPLNPDLKLWIGAMERLQACNVKNIGAIHRGFSVYESIDYRNQPRWEIALALKREYPDIELICDPSHIGGKREYIAEISQKAIDLHFDGLMIETHCDPGKARTDARQQLTPAQLKDILNKIVINKTDNEEIRQLRIEIDSLDEDLLRIISSRMKISGKIGEYKKQKNMEVLQGDRWEELLKRNIEKACNTEMTEEFATRLFEMIHRESVLLQEKVKMSGLENS